MQALEIKAKLPKSEKDGRAEDLNGLVVVQFPETIEEAIELYGGPAMLAEAKANFVIGVQGNIRTRLKAGQSNEQIQEALGSSKIGVKAARLAANPEAQSLAYLKTLTQDQLREMLAKLRS